MGQKRLSLIKANTFSENHVMKKYPCKILHSVLTAASGRVGPPNIVLLFLYSVGNSLQTPGHHEEHQ